MKKTIQYTKDSLPEPGDLLQSGIRVTAVDLVRQYVQIVDEGVFSTVPLKILLGNQGDRIVAGKRHVILEFTLQDSGLIKFTDVNGYTTSRYGCNFLNPLEMFRGLTSRVGDPREFYVVGDLLALKENDTSAQETNEEFIGNLIISDKGGHWGNFTPANSKDVMGISTYFTRELKPKSGTIFKVYQVKE